MTTETPRPDQIQANVAAALSRLRGEVVHTSSEPKATAGTGSISEPDVAEVPAGDAPEAAAPTLTAPDPSMALGASAAAGGGSAGAHEPVLSPLARMTGLNLAAEQPDLLAGIGTTPPPLADLPDPGSETTRRRLRNRLLAGAALVVVLGAFWVLSGHRDGGEEQIPVITADPTPEKARPIDEGGLEVPNTDVSILNGGEGTTTTENVLPPPEQPVQPPSVPAPAVPAIPSVEAPQVDQIPSVPAPAATEPTAVGEAAAEPSATGSTPTETAPVETATAEPAAAPVPEPATQVPSAASTSAEPEGEPAQAVPASLAGSARIQLAAVKTEAAAAKEWARLQKAYPATLGGLSLYVEKFNKSDSEVFYRLQAGPFADKAEAKRACSELKSQNQACIVAK